MKMVFVELPAEEIVKQAKKLRNMGIKLQEEADKFWAMCKPYIDTKEENTVASEDNGANG